MYKNTVGLLGGMGSYATLDFFERLLDAFPAEKEWDRPRIIIDNKCTMPSRVRAILFNESVDELIFQLSQSIKMMKEYSEKLYVVIACNTCHYFLPVLEEKFPEIKFINIIDALAQDLAKKGINSVFLLASEGTIKSSIYEKYFTSFGISINYPKEFETIRYFIECVKQRKIKDDDVKMFEEYISRVSDNTIVLGCTELPILAKNINVTSKKLADPLECAIGRLKQVMR